MRLRFTIRDLLWLMVFSATLLAWSVDHRRQLEQLHKSYQMNQAIEADLQEAINDGNRRAAQFEAMSKLIEQGNPLRNGQFGRQPSQPAKP
jgi:hypothetical protein